MKKAYPLDTYLALRRIRRNIGYRVMASGLKQKYQVLMADDCEDDCQLVEMAFRNSERLQFVGHVCDGEEAIAYLKGEGKFADREQYPFPDLLLLDLKMPRVDGYDVLRWLQTQSFPQLVVVVLSGSDRREDMAMALQLGAHFYQSKQVDLTAQLKMLHVFEQYLSRKETGSA
jgi:CheY-like chemotaxis protein